MQTLTAVIITDALDGRGSSLSAIGRTKIAGLSLIERAAASARAAGATSIHIVAEGSAPFADASGADGVFVIPANALIARDTLLALLRSAEHHPDAATLLVDRRPHAANRLVQLRDGRVTSLLADGEGANTDVALLSRRAVSMIGRVRSVRQAYGRLARFGVLYGADVASHTYEPLRTPADAACFESAFLPHSRGLVSEIRRLAMAMRCARRGQRVTTGAAVSA